MNAQQPSPTAHPGPAGPVRQAERGVAAVELALIMPVVATLLLATLDAATTARRAFEIQSLAEAGAKAIVQLDLLPARPRNSSGGGPNLLPPTEPNLPNVVEGAIPLHRLLAMPPATVGEARLFWGCGGDPVPPTATRCPDGSPLAPYVLVEASGAVDRLVSWPGVLLPPRVDGRALARLG
jgi:hypothetical protein